MAFCRPRAGPEILDGRIADVWFALLRPNDAPLEFYDSGVEGWVQTSFQRGKANVGETTKTSTSTLVIAADLAPEHANVTTDALPSVVVCR